jgi:hypothetical protein
VVGAPGTQSKAIEAGEVFIYARSGHRWRLQGSLYNNAGFGFAFGSSVSLSGSALVVGGDNGESGGGINQYGGAFFYARSGTRWHLQAAFADPQQKTGDYFGESVAIAGPTAIVSASGFGKGAGAVFIYTRSGRHWHRQAVLAEPHRIFSAGGFGGAVALSGSGPELRALITGLPVSGISDGPSKCGNAFEYIRTGTHWHEHLRIADPRCRSYDEFGFAAGLSGTSAIVGAPGASDNAGTVYQAVLPSR